MKFKGFDDWIPIFKGGKQVDSGGNEHDGDEIIERAIATFDPAHHEPPAVVGHPKDNAPAFGWVAGLKKIGNMLYAKFKQVVPEFARAVKDGLYKKRSISVYPDGRLRHVGFLGAAPPAVKGLADLKFDEADDAVAFEFYDPGLSTIAQLFRNLRDFLIEKEGKERADEIIPDWDVEYIKDEANQETETQASQPSAFGGPANGVIDDGRGAAKGKEDNNMSKFKERFKNFLGFMGVDMSKVPDEALPDDAPKGVNGTFTEADIEAVRKEAEDKTKTRLEAEFAENERKKQREARQGEISTWCDKMVKEGKLTPALVKYGIPEMLNFLAASEDVIEFGEGDGAQKATPYDRLKGLFETELPKLVHFGEIAGRGTDTSGDGSAAQKLDRLIKEKMAANKGLGYSAAFSEVQKERPDLVKEYQEEVGLGAE